MLHSTGDQSETLNSGKNPEIPYNTNVFTERELTFLDDVPQDQVDDFLEYIESKRFITSKWYFNNDAKVMAFEAERYSDVGDYFRYLGSLHE